MPNFKINAANNTDPIVEASTCASGNQMCKGNKGTLEANEMNNKNHRILS